MKFVVLLAVLAAGLWYALVGGRRLDEAQVRDFYRAESNATLGRDPEAQCRLLGKGVVIRQKTLMAGQEKVETLNHDQACESMRNAHQFFEAAGERAGGMLTIEYDYQLGPIEIAANRKSAAVEVNSTLKMGEAFMEFRTTSAERLERHWGIVELAEADASTRVRFTPGALADPSKYFRSQ